MELQQLRHLVAAARTGNYSQAAEQCSTSRQNIAHSIKVLEGECETTFFERTQNGMELTPAGRRAVEKAETIVNKIEALSFMFPDEEGERLHLSIAVSTNLFDGMPPQTEAFFMGLPDEMGFLEMDCGRCHDAVRLGKADVAIIMCMERSFSGCEVYEVAGSRTYALVSAESDLAKKASVSVDDLLGRELAVMSSPDFQYAPLFAQLDERGYDRARCRVVSGTTAVLHVVRRGTVGFVSGVFAASPPVGFVAVPLEDQSLNWHFYVLLRPHARNFSLLMKFCESVRGAFERDEAAYRAML